MTPAQVVSLFRSELGDSVQPYLWTKEDVFAYLTEAHSLFVRGLGGVPEVLDIPYTEGVRETEFPSTVLTVRRAYHPLDLREIDIRNIEEQTLRDSNYRTELSNGRPTALLVGLTPEEAHWSPLPETTGIASVAVYRATEVQIEDGNLNTEDVFEIPQRYHRSLVYGMAMQALLKQDAEAFDKTRAEEQRQMFANAVAAAEAERDRSLHRRRTVAYGGY